MAHSSLPMSLPHVSAIQATLQGPTPSIRYEAASENNDKRYEDRAGFEGFEVRSPVWERRSEARRVGCRGGVPVGTDAPPTEAPPTTAPCAALPPQTKLSEETKAMSELEEIDRRGDDIEPGAEGAEGAEVPLRTAMAALHPHRTQSPGRGPPSAPGAWDSPARSLTSVRSSLIVAQPRLLCTDSSSGNSHRQRAHRLALRLPLDRAGATHRIGVGGQQEGHLHILL